MGIESQSRYGIMQNLNERKIQTKNELSLLETQPGRAIEIETVSAHKSCNRLSPSDENFDRKTGKEESLKTSRDVDSRHSKVYEESTQAVCPPSPETSDKETDIVEKVRKEVFKKHGEVSKEYFPDLYNGLTWIIECAVSLTKKECENEIKELKRKLDLFVSGKEIMLDPIIEALKGYTKNEDVEKLIGDLNDDCKKICKHEVEEARKGMIDKMDKIENWLDFISFKEALKKSAEVKKE